MKPLLLCLALCLAAGAQSKTSKTSTIAVPGASQTYVAGISGDYVCGWYVSGSARGFVERQGLYQTFAYPGAQATTVAGCAGQVVVGAYVDASFGTHGFVYSLVSHDWVSYDHPGSQGVTVFTAVSQGRIAGYYLDAQSNVVSFILQTQRLR